MRTRMASATAISPKTIAATITAVLTYVLAQEALDLPVWLEVAGQAVLVALAAYFAPPGDVVPDAPSRGDLKQALTGDRGLTLLEAVVLLLVVAVVVIAIVVLA